MAGHDASSAAPLTPPTPPIHTEPATDDAVADEGALEFPSAEELVAKARAPVKRAFLRQVSRRLLKGNVDPWSDERTPLPAPAATASKVSTDKKSKRAMKRERQIAKKSADGLCAALAKTGHVASCPYGDDCRFNHDIASFLAQKPEDLEGPCPFSAPAKECPYGLACRFYGVHERGEGGSGEVEEQRYVLAAELNVLDKEYQKRLWKNEVKFSKADAQLKAMGIQGKCRPKEVPDDGKGREDKKRELEGMQDSCQKKVKVEDEMDVDQGCGRVGDDKETRLHPRERKLIDFRNKLYVAPLTTVGNLPFRRLCKQLGADITCGEMAMCTKLLQGQASEWALLRRHPSEDLFGVQICGSYPDTLARTAEVIDLECTVDFVDINVGCPIDIVVNKGAGSCLLSKPARLAQIVKAAAASMDTPLTVKLRMGYYEGKNCAHSLVPELSKLGATAITIHGRTRQQRYSKLADWGYIDECASQAPPHLQVIGNGDIFSFTDWNQHLLDAGSKLSTCMLARGALIKPWLLTEIKEQRHWDITSTERMELLKDYVRYGLEHWGSDSKGVETTRHFLLEWLSYTHRYIPVELLEVIPQRLNWRPPAYYGRNDLETLMASDSAADWVRISEMLLGPPPKQFTFTPKHKSYAYDRADNG